MKLELLRVLKDPVSGEKFRLVEEILDEKGQVVSGLLSTSKGDNSFPIINYIPRFVNLSNYADNFGMQWNLFSKTQIDSFSGFNVSEKRFYSATNWIKSELSGKWILDIGCGAGRFAEIALNSGANVVAIDYSNSVDACYTNLLNHENLHLVQADIYSLPFQPETFDYVYSLGVLQHTPDVKLSFLSLLPVLKTGGKLCVDFYEKSWKSKFLPKYLIRPISKHIPKKVLLDVLKFVVPPLLLISKTVSLIPFCGKYLKRLIPVANHFDEIPLTRKQLLEWSLLDTFDWFSPAYDNPQSADTVLDWFKGAGFENIEVLKAGHLVGRGKKL